jgi:hypothetical protein
MKYIITEGQYELVLGNIKNDERTILRLKALAEPFTKKRQFMNAEPEAYYAAKKLGVLDDLKDWEPTSVNKMNLPSMKMKLNVQEQDLIRRILREEILEYRRHSDESIRQELSKYKTLKDLIQNDINLYNAIRKRGKDYFDDVTKNLERGNRKYSDEYRRHSDESIRQELSKYKTLKDLIQNDINLYNTIRNKGKDYFDDVTKNLERGNRKYSDKSIRREVSKYKTLKDLIQNDSNLYNAIRRRGKDYFDDVTENLAGIIFRRHSDESIRQEVSKYKTLKDLIQNDHALYLAIRHRGKDYFDDVTKNLERGQIKYYSDESIRQEVSKYKTLKDLVQNDSNLYNAIRRRGKVYFDNVTKNLERIYKKLSESEYIRLKEEILMMEQMSGKYNKPTSEIEKLVYNLLNRYIGGSEVYRIEHFLSRHDLEWCKGGKEIMNLALFFEEIQSFGGDERKMEERPFNHGVLMMPEDKFRDILDIVPIRATYLSHLILQWFEDTKLADARTMFGRNDIDVDELSLNPKTADVCAPPPTKPDDITRDEMIDYIVTGTLFKRDDIEKRSDEWIEKMYLGKLRNQKEKELRGE